MDKTQVRLYLGCGDDFRRNRINVDIRVPVHIPEGVEFIESDVRKLPWGNETVDEISATHVIEHFIDPDPILQEWKRVLKKNGRLLLACPDLDRLIQLYTSGHWKIDQFVHYVYGGRNYEFNCHYNGFNEDRMRRTLERNGFHEIAFRKTNSKVIKAFPLRVTCRKR